MRGKLGISAFSLYLTGASVFVVDAGLMQKMCFEVCK